MSLVRQTTRSSASHFNVETPPAQQRQRGLSVVASPTRVLHTHSTPLMATYTSTRTWTLREKALALAAGTHPRCGARCALRLATTTPTTTTYGTPEASDGGTLALRLLWRWLVDNSRFYCLRWDTSTGDKVMITFGVSPVLLALTHGARWWVQRPGTGDLIGASRDYVVLQRAWRLYCLRDRLTGEILPVHDGWCSPCVGGKWLVLCDSWAKKMVVVQIQRRHMGGSLKKTVVGFQGVVKWSWKYFAAQFGSANEDQLLLWFCGKYPHKMFEIVLVDLRETYSSDRLAVLSSTIPRTYFMMTRESGTRVFAMRVNWLATANEFIIIEEGTGKLQQKFQALEQEYWSLSKLNESQFCVFRASKDSYEVWDINDTSKPVRTQKWLRGNRSAFKCSHEFVEGGLVFKPNESGKEIHVDEECSGANIITFRLFRPFHMLTHHASFLL